MSECGRTDDHEQHWHPVLAGGIEWVSEWCYGSTRSHLAGTDPKPATP